MKEWEKISVINIFKLDACECFESKLSKLKILHKVTFRLYKDDDGRVRGLTLAPSSDGTKKCE